ncbi:MAG: hypothetical protein ACI4IQ_02950 [Eubacterium sp.]
MKKALPLIFVFLLFAGCQIKDYTPEMPVTFKQNVTVTSGDFSYDCEICKNESNVCVTVLSTSAKGLVMTYDGTILNFNYSDFSYDIDGRNFEKTNPAIAVYEVFDYINNTAELNAKKIDGGFKYEGSVSLGDFILIQNDDNTLKSLTFRATDYQIMFK